MIDLTICEMVASAIRSRVDAFSDRRLTDGDDVCHPGELTWKCPRGAEVSL